MKLNIKKDDKNISVLILACFAHEKSKKDSKAPHTIKCTSQYFESPKESAWSKNFSGQKGEILVQTNDSGTNTILLGLGSEKETTYESIRRSFAGLIKQLLSKKISSIHLDLDSFQHSKNSELTLKALTESLLMTNYQFTKYKSNSKNELLKEATFLSKKFNPKKADLIFKEVFHVSESINLIRDFINECPSTYHSEGYADAIVEDAKKLPRVKIKVLNKKQIQAEKMNLFLSVNAGSAYEPRFVHLTYTPSKETSKTKHYALVGKGITYDTGGYSLKPATSMTGMKGDMGGSATVYGAFRSAVLNNCSSKISCLLVITDNKINSLATVPDTVVTGRNGTTVEILNTDAEGRLILADALDYACDLKPDGIIDAATLTGACLVALGKEVCAVLGNNEKLINTIKDSAKASDEYMWQLPIVQEYRDDIKSKVADIKNIGSPMRAGTAIGAVFLEKFIKNNIPWAHLDIAGVSDDQTHLPYCPSHGASGLIVRTLHHFLMNA